MNVISTPTRLLLSLSMLKGVGPVALKKASSVRGFVDKAIDELASNVPQISRSLANGSVWQSAQEAAAKQIDDAEKHRARILSPLDPEYPHLLAATKDDPFILYVQGSLASNPARSVAVIGTREPTIHGVLIAKRITQFFAEHDWSIVSGLAIGCDAIAHQMALDVGAHTVAVLAHGLHMIAPAKHKKLAQDILSSGGALVSEYPFGQNVQSQQYVKRDRTQAGMAQGVVMVQSDVKGGSLHASRASLDYGRWLAVPYPTDKDRENAEPKVQANLLIAEGTDAERADLLRCSSSALPRIMILRGREDYLRMIEPTGSKAPDLSLTPESNTPSTSEFSYNEGVDLQEEIAEVTEREAESHPTELTLPDTTGVEDAVTLPLTTEDAKGPVRSASASLLRETFSGTVIRCHVAVNGAPFIALNISRMPLPNLRRFEAGGAVARSSDEVLAALSARLRYVQTRLDSVNQMRCADAPKSEESVLFLRFSVEDALGQMRRAVDILSVLNRDNATSHVDRGLDDSSIERVSGEQLSLPVHGQGQSHRQPPLLEVLNGVLASSPESVVLDVGHDRSFEFEHEELPPDTAIDVNFDDLVSSFNELVTRTLYDDPSHVSP
jgi:DNA processing protein